MLETKIRPIVKPWIQEEQCGFQLGRRTRGQLHTFYWVLSQHVFCGSREGINRVPQRVLWWVLQDYAAQGPLLGAVQYLCDQNKGLVRIANSKSDLFPVHNGQSGLLFVTSSVH